VNEGHLIFGDEVIERFQIPIDREWTIAPDYGVWFEDPDVNKLLHRFTLHGMGNVEKCIDVIREKGLIEYDQEYEDEIRALVMSHSFLDLFNGPILPSYPRSTDVKFVYKHILKYPRVALNDPSGLDELFEEIVGESSSIFDLEKKMREEYEMVPWETGELTQKIVEHYKKHG